MPGWIQICETVDLKQNVCYFGNGLLQLQILGNNDSMQTWAWCPNR